MGIFQRGRVPRSKAHSCLLGGWVLDIATLIAKVKALVALTKDPTVGRYDKFRAYVEFLSVILPYVTNDPKVIGAEQPCYAETASVDDIVADIEASATVTPGVVGKLGDGVLLKKLLELALKLAPLFI